ncbi:MAG TPA: hypothetical protein VFB99_18730 [Vicinamibacterales bacterium]|nr:hypothetical protein [Vicinamibacterales bacterium]
MSKIAILVVLAAVFPAWVNAQATSGEVPKQVHLVVDGNRLVASNVRYSRFDELKLDAQESVRDTSTGEAVIVVVTNQRIIAYGVVSGWRTVDRFPNERIESVSAQDFAGLVVTTRRMLNFNGESGVWGERARRVSP